MFRDYSTYLHRIVRLERQVHDLCNERKYFDAKLKVWDMRDTARDLADWLGEQTPQPMSLRQAAELALDAIESGCSFEHLDNVVAVVLRNALLGAKNETL